MVAAIQTIESSVIMMCVHRVCNITYDFSVLSCGLGAHVEFGWDGCIVRVDLGIIIVVDDAERPLIYDLTNHMPLLHTHRNSLRITLQRTAHAAVVVAVIIVAVAGVARTICLRHPGMATSVEIRNLSILIQGAPKMYANNIAIAIACMGFIA